MNGNVLMHILVVITTTTPTRNLSAACGFVPLHILTLSFTLVVTRTLPFSYEFDGDILCQNYFFLYYTYIIGT